MATRSTRWTRCMGMDEFIIAGRVYPARNATEQAYLRDTARYVRWHARRYEPATLREIFADAARARYWLWSAGRLSVKTIARRKIALAWFVEVKHASTGQDTDAAQQPA